MRKQKKTKTNKNKKDWKGDLQSQMTVIGASNSAVNERQNEDYYATEPKAVRLLLEIEHFPKEKTIWECACGGGHLSEEMEKLGYNVYSSDCYDRGYGEILDFLEKDKNIQFEGNIITNPPYKFTSEFILRGMQILKTGNKLALFLPIRYLEGKKRRKIYTQYPPQTVYVSSGNLSCARGGDFTKSTGNAVSYAWFVWQKGHSGATELKWFN